MVNLMFKGKHKHSSFRLIGLSMPVSRNLLVAVFSHHLSFFLKSKCASIVIENLPISPAIPPVLGSNYRSVASCTSQHLDSHPFIGSNFCALIGGGFFSFLQKDSLLQQQSLAATMIAPNRLSQFQQSGKMNNQVTRKVRHPPWRKVCSRTSCFLHLAKSGYPSLVGGKKARRIVVFGLAIWNGSRMLAALA